VRVLQQYCKDKDLPVIETPIRVDSNICRKLRVISNLLRAYGKVSGRLPEWAEGIIREWTELIDVVEEDGDELEELVRGLLGENAPDDILDTH